MDIIKRIATLPLLAAFVACGAGDGDDAKADLSFLNDLELAVSAPAGNTAVSPLELAQDSVANLTPEPAPVAAPRRTSTSSSRSSSGTYSAPAPAPRGRVETVKHTKRDAAIGAGAGAVIGAVAGGPRNRVEGAVVGAVVGGVIGGVIGNNVDKSTRVVYE
jgi:hypothetical protein